MQVTTIAEASALVGRTFEQDGKRRTVTRVEPFGSRGYDLWWKIPGGKELANPTWCSSWEAWLSDATEVTSEVSDA